MKTCSRCNHTETDRSLFCSTCGAVLDMDDLKGVRLMGAIGVAHSSSPKIEEFWNTGDPNVFDRP